jgi:hypothetical protein
MGNAFSRSFGVLVLMMAACGSESSGASPTDGGGQGNDAAALPSCEALCPAVLVPKCPDGPVSQTDCVGGCQAIRASKCVDKHEALYACGGPGSVYACDSMGRTTVVGCESIMDALYTCMANL